MNKSTKTFTTTTTRARNSQAPQRRQPQVFIEVPLVSRRKVIGRLISRFRTIRGDCEAISSARIFIGFEENKEESDDGYATGRIKIASRDQAAVTKAAQTIAFLIEDLIKKATNPPPRRSQRDGGEARRAPKAMPKTAMEMAFEIALEKSMIGKKSTVKVAKTVPVSVPELALEKPQSATQPEDDSWTTVGKPKMPKTPKATKKAPKVPNAPKKAKKAPAKRALIQSEPVEEEIEEIEIKGIWGKPLDTLKSAVAAPVEEPKVVPYHARQQLKRLEESIRSQARAEATILARNSEPEYDAWGDDAGDDILGNYTSTSTSAWDDED